MKKIITTATFLVFGTMLMMAQTTKKKETKSTSTRTEMKAKSSVQQNNIPKMVDTANIEQRQKEADEKLQRQTIPQKDGLNNETVKPAQPQPVPGQLE
ncbi:hypothetical protein NG800_004235 [Epilithonimonas ginsengisoli]|uniref:Uncharacterized protein n=1 Tax=Epilithonimonas ginsengisoli TaxID=1245592 RepID=A0ABU4JEK5_9FLAO|nr:MULTISPECIES: hypothetical protein [Chryseobacterium group]MBV6879469.1 hypothetical protein [Epilithonimonas sp. FP105]MDW8548105.1 hypothetical protein [Epilithonimonas ginsengisoli]OAH64456.1 hypothetical protein AXA65_19040 [Chryseobacterium sp. FP211-J200]